MTKTREKMTSFPIKPDYIIVLKINEQLHMNYEKKGGRARRGGWKSVIKGKRNIHTIETDQK